MSTIDEVPAVKHRAKCSIGGHNVIAGDSETACRLPEASSQNTAALYGNDIATISGHPPKFARMQGPFPASAAFSCTLTMKGFTPGDAIDA